MGIDVTTGFKSFKGDWETFHKVLVTNFDDFKVKFQDFEKFSNFVNNLRRQNVITHQKKSGATAFYDERSIMEIVVARKYQIQGYTVKDLSGYLPNVDMESLKTIMVTNKLPKIKPITKAQPINQVQTISVAALKQMSFVQLMELLKA